MFNIGGELAFILQDVDFNTKTELVAKLKELKKDLKSHLKSEQERLKPIIETSLQQAYFVSKRELTNKKFCQNPLTNMGWQYVIMLITRAKP